MKIFKKGTELSLNTVILLILGVIVMVAIILIFYGGIYKLFVPKLKSFFQQIISLGG